MAIIVDKTTFAEFTGNTPDFEGDERYLIVNRDTIAAYQAFKAENPDRKFWKIGENGQLAVLSQGERDTLKAAEFAAFKQARLPGLAEVFNLWFQGKYTLENQQTIGYLMDEAERLNLPDRFAYFKRLGDWMHHFLDYYYSLAGQILYSPTIEQAQAIQPDFDAFMVQHPDPDVVIRTGRMIET